MASPGSLYATLGSVVDASTPTITIPVWQFDPTTGWWAYILTEVPSNYKGGGFRVSWKGGTDNTSVGTLELEVGMKVISDASILTGDLGLDSAVRTGIIDTPPTTPQDKLNYSVTGDITHSDAGSPSIDDLVALIFYRDVATDTNTGVMQVSKVLWKEI